jgi:formylglycine-generating enzyme required for sulfatase activity
MKFIKIKNQNYEMQDCPVTQAEWKKVMGTNPTHFKNKPNHPVESVSWDDCQEFIKKMNEKKDGYTYNLPTEEQWEFCAKSCDDQKIMEIAWCWENSKSSTHTVRKKKPNKLGLYDMLGNIWEWCQDEWK